MTTEEKLLNVIKLFSKLCETKQEILELLIPLTSTTLALDPADGGADGGAEWEKPS